VNLGAEVFARDSGDLGFLEEIICEVTGRVKFFAQSSFA